MTFSDSKFLFEILVKELDSYIDCKEFYIQSKFSNIFMLNLKDPNGKDPFIRNVTSKSKIKMKARQVKAKKTQINDKAQVGHSILFTSKVESLINAMKNFPIELSLFDKDDPETKLGYTHIPWSPVYIDYLLKLNAKVKVIPAHISGAYNIYDDFTFSRMATIKLYMKLTHLKDTITSSLFRSFPEETLKTNMHYLLKSIPTTAPNTIKELLKSNITRENCTIKKIKSTGKVKMNASNRSKTNKKKGKYQIVTKKKSVFSEPPAKYRKENIAKLKCEFKSSSLNYVKSYIDLDINRQMEVIKTKSCSSINRKRLNMLNFIFGDNEASLLRNQVLCVGYFTVVNDFNKDANSEKNSSLKNQSSETSHTKNGTDSKGDQLKIICDKECPSINNESSCVASVCSLNLPENAADLITITKCKQLKCNNKTNGEISPISSDIIQLDFTSLKTDCCDASEPVEKFVGEIKTKMKIQKDCFCSCECTFGFIKHTTHCKTCGGFERPGQDFQQNLSKPQFPCPIYHKLPDKKGSGSDKSSRRGSKSPTAVKLLGDGMNLESGNNNLKNKRKDERFKFKYGFTGIPAKIGHSRCVMPCTGTLGPVPKNMGWLWNAGDVPGIKCRPMYRAGAINKHVLRLLKIAKNPDTVLKKRRRESGKPKRPLKRPLLTVAKKDGEYTITMETMKVFSRPRAPNQHPYEDKPLVTYTIGRTEEENKDRQKKKEREKRRLERDQRTFIQSAFTDMCKEICLKTYQQALGILPDAEDPDCTCYPKHPGSDDINLELSCSCSEDPTLTGTETDSDEWIVEFTPPNAIFDSKFKGKKVMKTDNESQYTHLDYRVKLLDRYGNQVPRFFKGPDGSTQCSDLGGFWSPDKKWLMINIDGYIGPDERWAPLNFIGPQGEQVECDNGKFQVGDGSWLVVGVDGYIDGNGKWKYYLKPKNLTTPKKHHTVNVKKDARDTKADKASLMPSEVTWSCFGDANPKDISKLGILGHGQDKKRLLQTLNDIVAHGENIKTPQHSTVPRLTAFKNSKHPCPDSYNAPAMYTGRQRCKHASPSDKGIVADDGHGHKAYFKPQNYRNTRPKERINQLTHQGISLSSFHAPCFGSFINQEVMKKQQYDKFMKMKPCEHDPKTKCVSTQYKFRYTV